MRKIPFLCFAVFISCAALAQPNLTSAFNANKSGDYEEAVSYIEKVASDPKATAKEKYWRYRGNIYLNIAKDPALSAKYPDALATAVDSYLKGMALDTHGDYKNEVSVSLADAQSIVLSHAEKSYNSKDFCSAAKSFDLAALISDKFSIIDSAAIFNAAYCFDKCGNIEGALKGYKRCGEIGYNVPDVFRYSSELYTKMGKKEEALKVLSEARAKYPKDSDLLRSEVNIYLNENQYDKAETLLKSLTETDAKNEAIWFVLGVTYEKLGKKAEEEEAYKKALLIKPDYYDALFNLGAMYFNEGLDKEKGCADIPAREKAQYEECVSKSKIYFSNASAHLEKAYKLKPEDREIISALKDAYYKNENMEGYAKMKALLGS
ncbi:MAG: tetratricopeptide repeat protein [Crocinitomicaceae bacterium]|nr:tetratricopeptide repeat protein [Crocinitomicaceae bacterium]